MSPRFGNIFLTFELKIFRLYTVLHFCFLDIYIFLTFVVIRKAVVVSRRFFKTNYAFINAVSLALLVWLLDGIFFSQISFFFNLPLLQFFRIFAATSLNQGCQLYNTVFGWIKILPLFISKLLKNSHQDVYRLVLLCTILYIAWMWTYENGIVNGKSRTLVFSECRSCTIMLNEKWVSYIVYI